MGAEREGYTCLKISVCFKELYIFDDRNEFEIKVQSLRTHKVCFFFCFCFVWHFYQRLKMPNSVGAKTNEIKYKKDIIAILKRWVIT